MRAGLHLALGTVLLGVVACSGEKAETEPVRPVRTVVVEHRTIGEPVALSGEVRAADEISLSFRLGGKVIERLVSVDDQVGQDDVVARIDPQDAETSLRSAEADLAAAQATLAQAEADEKRQKELLAKGVVAQARYDQATQQLGTARSQAEAAEARVQSAKDQVGYTELHSDAAGIVTATGADPGEVVSAGQMIVTMARGDARDAVFDVPAQLIRNAPEDPEVQIALADDPSVTTIGHVREVAPQADPATRTYEVKVALENPPPAIRLGATVVGEIKLQSEPVIALPATALMQTDGKPAVWVVEPSASTVALRPIELLRYETDAKMVASGDEDGEVVVTAGVQALRPGQQVKLLEAAP
jgi:RND family efflux transporter MFP subunit